MNRRQFMISTGAVAIATALPPLAFSQEFEQLELFVPAAPGGGWDQTARVMDEVLRGLDLIGNSRITNVGGAGGTIGLPQFVNQYSGDGDSLMVGGMVMVGSIITNGSPVDLTSVTPIARMTGEYLAVVVPTDSPFQSMEDLAAAMRENIGGVSFAGGSAGGSDHMLAGLIAQALELDPVNVSYVAFAGGGEALAALLGNQVSAGVSGWGEFAEQVTAGALRVLAISAPERVAGIDAPTLMEQGIEVELLNWRSVFGAPDIDEEQRARLIELVTQLDASAEWQAALEQRSWTRLFLAGDEFTAYLEEDTARIREVLQGLGLA